MSFQQLQQDAVTASAATGVDPLVILSQWVNENGWDVPTNYNFGNITYTGAPGEVGYFTGSNGQKFAVYGNEQAGLSAYANLINQSYPQIAAVKGDSAQIKALQASPWDGTAHYPNLPEFYNEVGAKASLGGFTPMKLDLSQSGGSGAAGLLSPLANVSLLEWVLIGGAFVILLGVFF